jgi:hypothetical protein
MVAFLPTTAPDAETNSMVNSSVFAGLLSPRIVTTMFALCAPEANVAVPFAAEKSLPAFAEPSAVRHLTWIGPDAGLVKRNLNVVGLFALVSFTVAEMAFTVGRSPFTSAISAVVVVIGLATVVAG